MVVFFKEKNILLQSYGIQFDTKPDSNSVCLLVCMNFQCDNVFGMYSNLYWVTCYEVSFIMIAGLPAGPLKFRKSLF